MINKKYETFMEEFNKKMYVSSTSEYKRTAFKNVKSNINVEADVLFKEIMSNFLKGSGKNANKLDVFFEGERIKTKDGSVFIRKYKKDKILSYIGKSKNQKGTTFNITTYEITSTNRGYCILKYSFSTKLPGTVVGMNGMLGNIKFKKEIKKHGDAVIKFLKNKLETNN